MADSEILNPAKEYSINLKIEHHENAEKYFDEIAKKAGIDIEANRATVKKIKDAQNEYDDAAKHARKWKIAKAIFQRKKLKEQQAVSADKKDVLDSLIKEASEQMAPLNVLDDWRVPLKLFQETAPIIKLDNYYDARRYDLLANKYGLMPTDNDTSTLDVQSGEIVGNPFIIYSTVHKSIVDYNYSGSLTIHWVEYVTDDQGNERAVNRSETLVAHTTHPGPKYSNNLDIVFGSEACKDLSFTRISTGTHMDKESKEYSKYVKHHVKDLEKLNKQSVKHGGTFNKMSNDEFESLFWALDRNNEKEFRVMFSPLAQQSMIDLMTDKDSYGDDFNFIKEGELNFLSTGHFKLEDLKLLGNSFESYDYEEAKRKFVDYNDEFFKKMFFALAPILAIPVYQETKPQEYIYKDVYDYEAAPKQYEAIANNMDEAYFRPETATTQSILKTIVSDHDDNADLINVVASSYQGVVRTEYVAKFGGDGEVHQVPVEWTEYIPVKKVTPMAVKHTKSMSNHEMFNDEKIKPNLDILGINKNNSRFNRNLLTIIGASLAQINSLKDINPIKGDKSL